MTVATTSNKITYAGNGATTVFSFSFPGVAAADLQVSITDSLGNVTVLSPSLFLVALNPPIAPNPTGIGGSITYPVSGAPLASGSFITILRNLPVIQSTTLANQSIIYPAAVEVALDYLTMVDQGVAELSARSFQVGASDPVPAVVPTVVQRASQNAIWDASGNLTAGLPASGGGTISSAMQPVTSAATLVLARLNMGVSPNTRLVNTNYTVVPADDRAIIILNGAAFRTITVPAASGFASNFSVTFINDDTRAKTISIAGFSSFILWPTQVLFIWNYNSVTWAFTSTVRWVTPSSLFPNPVTFFVDPALGNDANDGLVAGAGAFATIQKAVSIIQTQCDGPFSISLADGTYTLTSSVLINQPVLGQDGLTITGDVATPGNCIVTAASGIALFTAQDGGVLNLSGVLMGASGGVGLLAEKGGVINVGTVSFGNFTASGFGMYARYGGTINVNGPYHIITGGLANAHINVLSSGIVQYNPGTVTIDGAVTVTTFMTLIANATLWSITTPTFVNPGNVTGQRYNVSVNSVATVGGGGALPPGSVAGATSTGGQFI